MPLVFRELDNDGDVESVLDVITSPMRIQIGDAGVNYFVAYAGEGEPAVVIKITGVAELIPGLTIVSFDDLSGGGRNVLRGGDSVVIHFEGEAATLSTQISNESTADVALERCLACGQEHMPYMLLEHYLTEHQPHKLLATCYTDYGEMFRELDEQILGFMLQYRSSDWLEHLLVEQREGVRGILDQSSRIANAHNN